MCAPKTRNDSVPDSDSEEDDDSNQITLRAKWSIDHSKTLDEVLQKLDEFKAYVKSLKDDGYELEGEITDDYGFLSKT